MSLLTSLIQPVVRRWSANQPVDSQSDAQACDRAHAGRDTDNDEQGPTHHGAVGFDGESVTSRSRLPSNVVPANNVALQPAVEPHDGQTVSSQAVAHDRIGGGQAGRGISSDLATLGIPDHHESIVQQSIDVGVPAAEDLRSSSLYRTDEQERPDSTAGGGSLSPTSLPIEMPRRHRLMGEAGQSSSLPADDGMAALRKKIHEIRDMAASSEDKAKRLHTLMTESYVAHLPHLARAQSPASFVSGDRPFTPNSPHSPEYGSGFQSPRSPASFAEPIDPANPWNLTEEDKVPTFRPSRSRRPSIDYEIYSAGLDDTQEPLEPQLGCKHYKRNVKIQCYDCKRWYSCRHCHDEMETSHALVRRKTENMFCMICQTPQAAGEFCVKCTHRAAWYYCDICKLWDDDNNKRIYHCADCGICRRGEGIGKDFVHCKRCNICIAIGSATTHRCIERAAECDCPICGDYMFTSSASIVAMPCGHYLHKTCYTRYMETAYKCPICKKSAVNMELQWRKLEHAIESQPMPREFRDTKIVIQCNDCSAKSSVRYHWLGNQCGTCDSFNTNDLQLLGPGSEEVHRNNTDHQRQRIEPRPPPMHLEEPETELRPRLQNVRSRTLPGALPRLADRLPGSYFLSVQDSTSDTSIRRTSIAQNIPFSPLDMFHRVSRSLSPIGHYLIADSDDEDGTAVDESEDVDFWGADGHRFLSGEEDDSEDEDQDDDDDSDDGSYQSESEEDEDVDMAQRLEGNGHARRDLDDLDQLTGHR